MKQRCHENLQAAELLIARDLANAAASRAYYAAYHAGWHLLDEAGEEPPDDDGRRYWRHDEFHITLFRTGVLGDPDDADLVAHLCSHRIRADYYEWSHARGGCPARA